MTETQQLHKQIKEMELELQRIRANHPPDQRMTEEEAALRAEQQIADLEELTDQSSRADTELEVVQREIKRLGKENVRLGKDEEREEARAREVREGREAGDTRVDEICHWYVSLTLRIERG
jgi:seryl-tRNA synthetase